MCCLILIKKASILRGGGASLSRVSGPLHSPGSYEWTLYLYPNKAPSGFPIQHFWLIFSFTCGNRLNIYLSLHSNRSLWRKQQHKYLNMWEMWYNYLFDKCSGSLSRMLPTHKVEMPCNKTQCNCCLLTNLDYLCSFLLLKWNFPENQDILLASSCIPPTWSPCISLSFLSFHSPLSFKQLLEM